MLSDRTHDELLAKYQLTLQRTLRRVLAYWKANRDPTGQTLLPSAASAVAIDKLLGPLSTADRTLLAAAAAEVAKHPDFLKLNLGHLALSLQGSLSDLARPLEENHRLIRSGLRSVLVEATTRNVSLKEGAALLNQRLARPVSNARTLVNTALAELGRDATLLLHTALAGRVGPQEEMLLGYSGPSGGPIRPLCARLVGKAFTLEQVQRMVNSAGTSVLRQQGGPNCRHSWAVVPKSSASRFGFDWGRESDVRWTQDQYG